VETEVVINELSDDGKQVIEAARCQSHLLSDGLTPRNAQRMVDIWEAGDDPSEKWIHDGGCRLAIMKRIKYVLWYGRFE
jgi:hypothetical protein